MVPAEKMEREIILVLNYLTCLTKEEMAMTLDSVYSLFKTNE
jgi:hypothetical protein